MPCACRLGLFWSRSIGPFPTNIAASLLIFLCTQVLCLSPSSFPIRPDPDLPGRHLDIAQNKVLIPLRKTPPCPQNEKLLIPPFPAWWWYAVGFSPPVFAKHQRSPALHPHFPSQHAAFCTWHGGAAKHQERWRGEGGGGRRTKVGQGRNVRNQATVGVCIRGG